MSPRAVRAVAGAVALGLPSPGQALARAALRLVRFAAREQGYVRLSVSTLLFFSALWFLKPFKGHRNVDTLRLTSQLSLSVHYPCRKCRYFNS